MDSSESLAADLAVLTDAVDDPDIDLGAELGAVIVAAKAAIASYLGMSMTTAVDGHEVSITVNEQPGATPIAASLLIPLPAVCDADTGSALTVYAATPGAFVDLAADLSYALSLPDTALVLDEDLAPTHGAGVTGLDRHTAINQAIGVLLERGHPRIGPRATAPPRHRRPADHRRTDTVHEAHERSAPRPLNCRPWWRGRAKHSPLCRPPYLIKRAQFIACTTAGEHGEVGMGPEHLLWRAARGLRPARQLTESPWPP